MAGAITAHSGHRIELSAEGLRAGAACTPPEFAGGRGVPVYSV